MIGCTRCGSWHEDAEVAEGKRLSCTEVKQFWVKIRHQHNDLYGHFPKISRYDDGRWMCIECKREIL